MYKRIPLLVIVIVGMLLVGFVILLAVVGNSNKNVKVPDGEAVFTVSPSGIGDNNSGNNENEFTTETIEYIDDEGWKFLEQAYSQIDFTGTFEKGDIELYGLYKGHYRRFLNRDATYADKVTGKEFYIDELCEQRGGDYNLSEIVLYFFDMDGDKVPELGISDGIRYISIIKYDIVSDKFSLWYNTLSTWNYLIGTKKNRL